VIEEVQLSVHVSENDRCILQAHPPSDVGGAPWSGFVIEHPRLHEYGSVTERCRYLSLFLWRAIENEVSVPEEELGWEV
jgi:hypothetical protein